MKRPMKRVLSLGGATLLALSILSFVYWSSFVPADGLIEDITFTGTDEQSQLISYEIDGTYYEAEFLLEGYQDQETVDLLAEQSDSGTYQLAPTTSTKTFTALVGLLGTLMLSRAYRTKIKG